MAIAIDSSTPAAVAANTSNSFSPPAGSSLLILWASHFNRTITSISDSLGSHLTYVKLIAYSEVGDDNQEIWIADCPSAQTGMTLTVTPSAGTPDLLGVVVLTGAAAAASQTGTTGTQGTFSGTPSISVTTTADGSWVFGALGSRGTSAPTIPAGQTDVFNGQTFQLNVNGWAQATSSPTTSSGTSVTLNDTAPTGVEFGFCVAEILAAPSAAAVPAIDILPDMWPHSTFGPF